MSTVLRPRSVSVVGGGVIGLSIAWRAAHAGWSVRLYDPAIGSGASWVAGGMLAPLSEGWPGEESVLELGSASLDRWREFGKELDHAWFVGFAPADDAKIVVAVMIEFGGHGTRAAAIASAIIANYLKVTPISTDLLTEG